ncbi:MAG: hypothetical protein O6924_03840, partial [Alphaproteobacteria bacterium]|nr:hypothetical protein [Alphaproteobacteria bacterium]
MPRHIERKERRLTWYATLTVPHDVRRKLGRNRFRQSLGTRDPKVAERLAAPLVAEWQSAIASARGDEAAENDPAFWRRSLAWANTREERVIVEHELMYHVQNQGYDNTDPEAQRFYARAFGSIIDTTEHLEEWLGSLQV